MKSLTLVVALAIIVGVVAFAPLGSSPTQAMVHIAESTTLPEQLSDTIQAEASASPTSDSSSPCALIAIHAWHPVGAKALLGCVAIHATVVVYDQYIRPLEPEPRSINPNIKGGWMAPICPPGNGGLACGW